MAIQLYQRPKKIEFTDFPFEENAVYTIFIDPQKNSAKQFQQVRKSLTRLFNKFQQEQPGYVLKKPAFVNYLSILQNMILSVSLAQPKLRSPELTITDALEESSISLELANQKVQALSLHQLKEVQLITNLCSGKRIIFVDDWLKDESDKQLKNWLLIFRSLVKQKKVSVILVTSNSKIAQLGELQLTSENFI